MVQEIIQTAKRRLEPHQAGYIEQARGDLARLMNE
jgi:hypothetical protein